MTAQRNHYEVLGVAPTANTDQIKKKYRELARKFHPDVVKDKALGQKVFTQINQAYRVLADPERRAQYDANLRAETASATIVANGVVRPGANGAAPTPAAAPNPAAVSPQQAQSVARLISDADFALMNGDVAAALTHLETALRADPRNAKALGLLGDALAAQNRREEAAAAYRRSLEAAPSPMIQAKLTRLQAAPAQTVPPTNAAASPMNGNGAARPANGAARPAAPTSAPAQSGGLFGRLLGKKK